MTCPIRWSRTRNSTRSKRASITAGPIAMTSRPPARNSSRISPAIPATGISAPARRSIALPLSLLPPHAAPLGHVLLSAAASSRSCRGKLVIGLHGYRPTGSRIIFYDVDGKGFPKISPPPVRYHVSCAAEPSRAFQTEESRGRGGAIHRARHRMAQGERHPAAGRARRHDGGLRRRDLAGRGPQQDRHPHRQRGRAGAAGPAALRRQIATGDRRTRQIRPERPVAEPAADNDPHRPRREALSKLPFGLRIEAGPCGARRKTKRCCASCCPRTDGYFPAIPDPAGCMRASMASAPSGSCRPTRPTAAT